MDESSPKVKAAPDWERIEADYRAGLLSLREIAEPYTVSHTAIKKRADREHWVRDLTAKIRAKAEALVSKDAVSSSGNAETKASEKEIVDANAELVANVDRRHKSTARKGQALIEKLLAEVEGLTDEPDLAEQLFELLNDPHQEEGDGKPPSKAEEERLRKMREAFNRIMSLPGRVDSLKKLAETFEKFAKFERIAYRLEDVQPPADTGDLNPDRVADGVRRLAFILQRAAQEPAHG